jgi:short-subunit dehydrogenase
MKNQKAFENRVVWLTGASSGIGEQLAYLLNEAGAHLILSARKQEKLEKVKAACPRQELPIALLAMDLADLEVLPDLSHRAWELFGHIDYMIHVAGVSIRGMALDTEIAMDEYVMRVNHFGPVVITRELVPKMLERGFAHIAATTSLSGKYGVPQLSAYAASKHAMHGFFESLRAELYDQGLRITMLVPGMIRTKIIQHGFDGHGKPFDHNIQGMKEGFDPKACAERMMFAIRKNKQEYFIGNFWEKLTLWLSHYAPESQRWLLRNRPMRMLRRMKSMVGLYPASKIK